MWETVSYVGNGTGGRKRCGKDLIGTVSKKCYGKERNGTGSKKRYDMIQEVGNGTGSMI